MFLPSVTIQLLKHMRMANNVNPFRPDPTNKTNPSNLLAITAELLGFVWPFNSSDNNDNNNI